MAGQRLSTPIASVQTTTITVTWNQGTSTPWTTSPYSAEITWYPGVSTLTTTLGETNPSGGQPFQTVLTLMATRSEASSTTAPNDKSNTVTTITILPKDKTSPTLTLASRTKSSRDTAVTTVQAPPISIGTARPAKSVSDLANKPSEFTSDVLAGIGLGCAVAGAILGALLFWLTLCRRRHRKGQRDPNHRPRLSSAREKAYRHGFESSNGLPPPKFKSLSLEPLSVHDAAFLAPLNEFEVAGEMMKLSDAIEHHVESYYASTSPVNISHPAENHNLLSLLGPLLPKNSHEVMAFLIDHRNFGVAARFLLAWTILQSVQTSSSPENTLLPPHLSECLEDMKSCVLDDQVQSLYFSKWRQLTATLLQHSYDHNSIECNDTRLINIQELHHKLNGVLELFATDEDSQNDRFKDLQCLIKLGARLGYKLFSQPTDWSFDWNDMQPDAFVVYPALVQLSDGEGRRLAKLKRHTNAKIVRVDTAVDDD